MQAAGGTREMQAAGGTTEMQAAGGAREMQAAGGTREMQAEGGTREMQAEGGTREMQAERGTREMQAAGGTRGEWERWCRASKGKHAAFTLLNLPANNHSWGQSCATYVCGQRPQARARQGRTTGICLTVRIGQPFGQALVQTKSGRG
eukprot:350772-Chlamydomonas_euryale.AAC.2